MMIRDLRSVSLARAAPAKAPARGPPAAVGVEGGKGGKEEGRRARIPAAVAPRSPLRLNPRPARRRASPR